MPRVLNIRDLPGFASRKPIVPPDAVYIGRGSGWYGLRCSDWANLPLQLNSTPEERDQSIADYEARLRCDAVKMARLSELRGRDLICWCAPERCHGDVLLRLANG